MNNKIIIIIKKLVAAGEDMLRCKLRGLNEKKTV
jgi:hypothetical protein